MTPITPLQLVAAGIGHVEALNFAAPLTAACAMADIDTPGRIAAFVAQCSHESARFTKLVEDLYWLDAGRLSRTFWSAFHGDAAQAAPYLRNPAALANHVYAFRNGNGDEASGDGFRFRGRGAIMTTGRMNYRIAGYENAPDRVATPEVACSTAAQFWSSHGLNAMADAGDIDRITRFVNGPAMVGAADRAALFAQAQEAFA